MKIFYFVTILLISLQLSAARIFSRCDLANELLRQGFPRANLENWVCLIEAESSSNTAVVGGPNTDGSYDWGLFQINDRYWCTPNAPGGSCGISCNDIVTDDITVASTCAKAIFNISGFGAWTGWRNKCQGGLPNIGAECGVKFLGKH